MPYIDIEQYSQVWRDALGRQRSGNGWCQLRAIGEQAGPVVAATVCDDEHQPIERLVVRGTQWTDETRALIRAFVAEFPDAEIPSCTWARS